MTMRRLNIAVDYLNNTAESLLRSAALRARLHWRPLMFAGSAVVGFGVSWIVSAPAPTVAAPAGVPYAAETASLVVPVPVRVIRIVKDPERIPAEVAPVEVAEVEPAPVVKRKAEPKPKAKRPPSRHAAPKKKKEAACNKLLLWCVGP